MVTSSDSFHSRRSSADSLHSPPRSPTAMFISLPDFKMPCPKARRAAVTPPSVTPPSVSTSSSSISQYGRDRCKSPSQKASDLLAKVAVLPSVPGVMQPTSSGISTPALHSSSGSTPASSPPGECAQFSFGEYHKQLPHSPDGGYISFPNIEGLRDYKSDDEDSEQKNR